MLVAPQTVVGAVAFPDFLYSTPNVLGLALSMIGAVWYAMQSAMRVGTCLTACLQYKCQQINSTLCPKTQNLHQYPACACCLTCRLLGRQ